MKISVLAAVLALAIPAASAAQAAITVHTASFLTTTTNLNGFEGMGYRDDWVGPFTEGGITAEYVGVINASGKGIWTWAHEVIPVAGVQGRHSWYENGGGLGYTKVTLADGGSFNSFQVAVSSGWGADKAFGYQLLNNGAVLQEGIAGTAPRDHVATFGFSGATFDEVRLQVLSGGNAFHPTGYDAGLYDNLAIGTYDAPSAAVPEPAAWALMISGFGLAGAALRRRRAVSFA